MTDNRVLLAVLALPVLLAACTTETHSIRAEAVTIGAGDAQAANTALQMIDPWPRGVNDTALSVPADRTPFDQASGAAAEGVRTTDTGN
jgi:hypothetical protein